MKDCSCRPVRVLGAESRQSHRGVHAVSQRCGLEKEDVGVDGKARQGRRRSACIGEKGKRSRLSNMRTVFALSLHVKRERYENYRTACPPGLPALHSPPLFTLHHRQVPQGPPATQGQAPRIPDPHPGGSPALSDLRGLRGWSPPCGLQGPALAQREPPRCSAALNGGQDPHLPLACSPALLLGGAVTFRLVPGLFTGLARPPCSSGSRNGTLLSLSIHTAVEKLSPPNGVAKPLLLPSVHSPTTSQRGL
jgi:hypothetical protein